MRIAGSWPRRRADLAYMENRCRNSDIQGGFVAGGAALFSMLVAAAKTGLVKQRTMASLGTWRTRRGRFCEGAGRNAYLAELGGFRWTHAGYDMPRPRSRRILEAQRWRARYVFSGRHVAPTEQGTQVA